MQAIGNKVPATFKVDMSGVDVSRGVYVTGDFPNARGEHWKLNSMVRESEHIYTYSTELEIGATGAYYFLNDSAWEAREKVPAECVVHWGLDRGFEVPAGSDSVRFAYVWSSCEEIRPLSVAFPDPYASLYKIFPNPIQNDQLHLAVHVSDRVHLSVLDLRGKVMLERDLDATAGDILNIDLGAFSDGVYLISLHFIEHQKYSSELFLYPGN
jgi:arabinogalactan endo-1,4-beta-galactosidase